MEPGQPVPNVGTQTNMVTAKDFRETLDHLVQVTIPQVIRTELAKNSSTRPDTDEFPHPQQRPETNTPPATPAPTNSMHQPSEDSYGPNVKPPERLDLHAYTIPQDAPPQKTVAAGDDTRRFTYGEIEGDLYVYVDALSRDELNDPETTQLAHKYAHRVFNGRLGVSDTGFVRMVERGETPQPQIQGFSTVYRRAYRFLRLI